MPATELGDPLTDRQAGILSYIRRHMMEFGSPPTVREIGAAFRIRSPNGVRAHLLAMARKGVVQNSGDVHARGWAPVVPEGCCPCCGRRMEGDDR